MTAQASGSHDLLVVGANPAIDLYYCLDHLQVGDVNRVAAVRAEAGGKANNLARAYRRLGGRPLTTGIAGGDTGRRILDRLTAEGIAHDYVDGDGESRQTVTAVANGVTTVLLEPGPLVNAETLARLEAKVATLASTASAVAIVGSLPPGASKDFLAELVRRARAASAGPVALDTSGEALQVAAFAGPHVIKINADEYERAFRQSARNRSVVEAHFQSLADRGLETLCITDGPRGALIFSTQARFVVRTETDGPISTAGAGDAFLAGFLFALHRGDGLTAAARLASAAAAAALRTVGAGCIEPADVDMALSRTQVLDVGLYFGESPP